MVHDGGSAAVSRPSPQHAERADLAATDLATPGGGTTTPPMRDQVQSLVRGLAVVRAFDATSPSLTLTEVAQRSSLTRAAARRFLLTLVELGYVETDGRQFRLTPRVLDLGFAYLSSLSIPEVALPHLEALVATVEDSSELAVLNGQDVVYVLRVTGPRILTAAVSVGARMPAHATSLGRVLLADLPEDQLDAYFETAVLRQYQERTVTDPVLVRDELRRVAAQGHAIIDQELEEGLIAVAVPIRGRDGRAIAAANLSSHVGRRSLQDVQETLLPALHAAVREIETDLRVTGAALRT